MDSFNLRKGLLHFGKTSFEIVHLILDSVHFHIELAKYLTVVKKLFFNGFGTEIEKLVNDVVQQLIVISINSNLMIFNLYFKDRNFKLYLFNE
jgi:hypothetical protein